MLCQKVFKSDQRHVVNISCYTCAARAPSTLTRTKRLLVNVMDPLVEVHDDEEEEREGKDGNDGDTEGDTVCSSQRSCRG